MRWFESTPPQRHLRWCHPGQCHWSDRCKERQVCTLLTMINVILPSSCPREKEVCNNNTPLAEVGRTQLHVRRYASPKKPSTAYRNSRPRRTGPSVETDSLTASTQVFATLQRRTIEEWPFCEQNNTLLGFTALFTHHNYPPHFEEVGENSFGVGFA